MQMGYTSNKIKCKYLFQEIFGNPQLNIRYSIDFGRVDFQHKFPKQHTISQFQWQPCTIHHPFRTGILLGIPNKIWFIFQEWKYKSTEYLWKLFINSQWLYGKFGSTLWRSDESIKSLAVWGVNLWIGYSNGLLIKKVFCSCCCSAL